MSGSCCGGSPKSEPAKVAVTATPQATAEKPVAKSDKNECCNGKTAKSEKHGCGC